MHRKVTGAAAVALALVVVGCGGGGGDEPLTKAAFVRQVNKLCNEPVPKASKSEQNDAGPLAFLTQVLGKQVRMEAGFKKITPPDEAKDGYADFMTAQDERRDLFERAIKAAKADPADTLEALDEEGSKIQQRLERLASELGVKSCA